MKPYDQGFEDGLKMPSRQQGNAFVPGTAESEDWHAGWLDGDRRATDNALVGIGIGLIMKGGLPEKIMVAHFEAFKQMAEDHGQMLGVSYLTAILRNRGRWIEACDQFTPNELVELAACAAAGRQLPAMYYLKSPAAIGYFAIAKGITKHFSDVQPGDSETSITAKVNLGTMIAEILEFKPEEAAGS